MARSEVGGISRFVQNACQALTLASAVMIPAVEAGADSGRRGKEVYEESVDVMEVNHFYYDQGRHTFDQIIFYDWDNGLRRHQVKAWRLVKNPAQYPQTVFHPDGEKTYQALWFDNDWLRKVTARSKRESWTQVDPELVEREYLAKEKRKNLLPTPVIKTPPAPPTTPIPGEEKGDTFIHGVNVSKRFREMQQPLPGPPMPETMP